MVRPTRSAKKQLQRRHNQLTCWSDDGIVVVGVGEDDGMQANSVSAALSERLGPDATSGLLQAFELERRAWSDEVLNIGAERFERRLAETGSALRVQIAQTEAALRQEIAQLELRLRQEMSALETRLRQDLGGMEVRLMREIANSRVELLKWSFLFWIGQVVAVSALMAAMLRVAR